MKVGTALSIVVLALLSYAVEARRGVTCHPVGKPGPFVGLTHDYEVQYFKFESRHGEMQLVQSEEAGQELQFWECSRPSQNYREKNSTSPNWYAGQLRLKSDAKQCVSVGNVTIATENAKTGAIEPVADPQRHVAGIRLEPCAKGNTQDMRLQWWGMANTTMKGECKQELVITGWDGDFTYGGPTNGISDLNVQKGQKSLKANERVDFVTKDKSDQKDLFSHLGVPEKTCRRDW